MSSPSTKLAFREVYVLASRCRWCGAQTPFKSLREPYTNSIEKANGKIIRGQVGGLFTKKFELFFARAISTLSLQQKPFYSFFNPTVLLSYHRKIYILFRRTSHQIVPFLYQLQSYKH